MHFLAEHILLDDELLRHVFGVMNLDSRSLARKATLALKILIEINTNSSVVSWQLLSMERKGSRTPTNSLVLQILMPW
jgi:hypothetical protein